MTSSKEKPQPKKYKVEARYDFVGIQLNEGDLVAYSMGSSQNLGLLVGFTPKGVRVRPIRETRSSWRGEVEYINRQTRQVVKISEEAQAFKDLPRDWIMEVLKRPE